ncbi:MAG TPA: HAD family hydrolase, partial [Longimicrobiales bacterium]|nr:HAD family hydrolase [Longimicrobiales bacterium]
VEAFADTPGLRDRANLVLVAGTRDDITETDPATRRVVLSILIQVDRHDLYGVVAYPKHHHPSDVPDLYRLAARSGGVFVNPALTEPFGLTLIEAAACGLPVVATDDGGPRDIIEACRHGLLVDVMDTRALGRAIMDALSQPVRRARWAKNAVSRVHRKFSWRTHTRRYLEAISEVGSGVLIAGAPRDTSSLPRMDRMLFAVLDDVLAGDEDALVTLAEQLEEHRDKVGVGITTGRTTRDALDTLETLGFIAPDVLISASGTEIHYGPRLIRDRSWERQIRHRWDPDGISRALADLSGLRPDEASRTRYRLRYVLRDPSLGLPAVRARLRKAGLRATALLDRGDRLDIVPGRASPGMAVRFMSFKWNLPPTRLLVAGDAGSGADLLSGDTLGVVVGCDTGEPEELADHPRVYFASNMHGWGVLEGVAHYDFFGEIQPHDEELA